MKIKKFKCGLCLNKKKAIIFTSTRKGLRDHLKEEHFIFTELTNMKFEDKKTKKKKRDWWLEEVWE